MNDSNNSYRDAVKLEDVSRAYGFTLALKRVNLRIAEGETVGFVGNNGAGKSTLLKIVSLLVKPTAGRIKIFGSEVNDNQHVLKKDIGTLLSESFFYEDMTGRENLEFFLKMMGNRQLANKAVENAIKKYDLRFYIDRPVHELSTGMAKKLEILRVSLPRPPRLLLLDEPFSGLDVDNRKFLNTFISDKQPDTTVLISSHNFRVVTQLCDRVFLLEKGRLARILEPSDYDSFLKRTKSN
ncbi:MAG: ABC transporter ATP-binding protein [Candidatus Heimdallarchaeota archaeon]